jgi:hypothetical protein
MIRLALAMILSLGLGRIKGVVCSGLFFKGYTIRTLGRV